MLSNTTTINGSTLTPSDSIYLLGNIGTANDGYVYSPYINYGTGYNSPYGGLNMWSPNTIYGNHNVMIGYNSGSNTTTGNYNYYIGWDCGYVQKTKEELKRESRRNKLTEIFGDDI